MQLIVAHSRLLGMGQPVFTTTDAAAVLGVPSALASKMLVRLACAGHVVQIRRALWALVGRTNALQLAHQLTAPLPAYVSLQTALFHHGLISQIPDVTYVVSLARTCRIVTPFGAFSVHHVQRDFFFGYAILPDGITRMASPEKALADFLYLGPAKSLLFRSLPELEFPRRFRETQVRAMIERIPDVRRRSHALHAFEQLRRNANPPAR